MNRYFFAACIALSILVVSPGNLIAGHDGFARNIDHHVPCEDAQSALSEAQKLRSAGKTSEAIAALRKFLAEEDDPLVYFYLGDWLFRVKDRTGALKAFEKAVELTPIYPAAYRNLGRIRYWSKDWAGAALALTKALSQGPGGAGLLGLLGQCYFNLEMYVSAIETFRNLLVLDPDRLDVRMLLTECHLRVGNGPEAERLCHATLKRMPGNPVLWEYLGNAYLFQQKYSKAAEVFDSLRRLGKASPRVLRTLGDLYFAQDNYRAAAKSYEAAFTKTTPDIDSLRRLVKGLYRSGQFDASLAWCDRLIGTSKGALEGNLLRAKNLFRLSKDTDGEKALQKVLSISPDHGEALYLLAKHFLRAKRLDPAKEHFRRLTTKSGFEGKGWAGLGRASMKQGAFKKALKYMNRALEYDPGNSSYYAVAVALDRALKDE